MLKFTFKHPILWLNSLFVIGIICMAIWRWDWIAAKLFAPEIKSIAVNIENNNHASIVAANPLKDILAANLFGNPKAVVIAQKQISTEKIPKSKQQLTLKGLLYYPEHPHSSAALISNADAPAKNYHLGQKLQDAEGKIYAILKDSVQIESNGNLEKLTLLSLIAPDNEVDLDSLAKTSTYNKPDVEELETKPDPAKLLHTFGLIETAEGMNFSADKKLPAAFKITDNIVSINNYDMLDLVDYPELLAEVLVEKELIFEVDRGEETLFLTILKTEIVNN